MQIKKNGYSQTCRKQPLRMSNLGGPLQAVDQTFVSLAHCNSRDFLHVLIIETFPLVLLRSMMLQHLIRQFLLYDL